MGMDYNRAKESPVPYMRRRQAMEREQAAHTAAAQVPKPEVETAKSVPYFPALKKCVCGARPRYGFDVHVQHCAAAKAAAAAEIEASMAGVPVPPDGPLTVEAVGIKPGSVEEAPPADRTLRLKGRR